MRAVILGLYPRNPMKISRGGIESSVYHLVEGLRKFNEVEIFVISCSPGLDRDQVVHKENLHIVHLSTTKRLGNITFGYFDRVHIKKVLNQIKPDIIHSHDLYKESLAALQTNFPVVVTIHGILWKEVLTQKGLKAKFTYFFRKIIVKKVLKLCRYLILISPYVWEEIHNLTNAETVLIDNPVKGKLLKLERKEKEGQLLFLGAITRGKNLLTLIKAINHLKDEFSNIKLVIAGAVGDEIYYREIKQYILENKLQRCLLFLGNISSRDLERELSHAAIAVLPSFQETSPISIIEAMSAGVAIVASKVGGIPYLIKDGFTGLMVTDPNSVEEFVDKIKILLKDRQIRDLLGVSARKAAGDRFPVENIAAKTFEFYRKVIKEWDNQNISRG